MKRLTQEDREWFLEFLRNEIKEAEFNSYRYKTEECYERVSQLKRIYNILSHKN